MYNKLCLSTAIVIAVLTLLGSSAIASPVVYSSVTGYDGSTCNFKSSTARWDDAWQGQMNQAYTGTHWSSGTWCLDSASSRITYWYAPQNKYKYSTGYGTDYVTRTKASNGGGTYWAGGRHVACVEGQCKTQWTGT